MAKKVAVSELVRKLQASLKGVSPVRRSSVARARRQVKAGLSKKARTFSWKQIFNSTPAGSLHAALGVPHGVKIPIGKLQWAAKTWSGGSPRQRKLAAKAALTLRFALKRRAVRNG